MVTVLLLKIFSNELLNFTFVYFCIKFITWKMKSIFTLLIEILLLYHWMLKSFFIVEYLEFYFCWNPQTLYIKNLFYISCTQIWYVWAFYEIKIQIHWNISNISTFSIFCTLNMQKNNNTDFILSFFLNFYFVFSSLQLQNKKLFNIMIIFISLP